jgi:hypothetical protein
MSILERLPFDGEPIKPPPETLEERRARKNEKRGFSILYELFFFVLAAEFGIDGASILMAWIYAKEFAPDDTGTQLMSVGAAVVLSIFEAARIPAAFALRTETSAGIKAFCMVAILGSAPITAFNLAQLLNIPAQSRLNAVRETKMALATAEDRTVTFKEERQTKSDDADRAERVLGKATERAESGSNNVAELSKTCWHGHCGHVRGEKDLQANSKEARAAAAKAQAKLDKARVELLGMDESAIKSELRNKENDYRKAVLASPLHRFASMIFGGDPAQQSDTTIAWTVRLWVGIPSALGACLSVLLTMIAIKPLPRPKPDKEPDDEDTIKIGGDGMAEFGAAVSEYGQTLREAEDMLRDDSTTPELPAPAKVEPRADNAKAKRTPKNAVDGRTRQGKAAKRKAKNGAANNVLKFPRDKESYPDGDIPF